MDFVGIIGIILAISIIGWIPIYVLCEGIAEIIRATKCNNEENKKMKCEEEE